ncbi:MAG: hypothetical protein U5O39_13375 [Gammaproteobacteria bacterium]|nr:hypothetical protein [Gammaproteobacteria bacterium]
MSAGLPDPLSGPTALRYFARNVVATSQPLAVWAGLKATGCRAAMRSTQRSPGAIALTVVEPNKANGIGSDAFAMVAGRATGCMA